MSEPVPPVAAASEGLDVAGELCRWTIEPFRIAPGTATAFVPIHGDDETDPDDPSRALARVLSTLAPPERGAFELLGAEPYRIRYEPRQRMRDRIGLVQGEDGLLSSLSVRENVGLPLSVHGRVDARRERERSDAILAELGLSDVADRHPHELARPLRRRVRIARALVLEPPWLVCEGIGEWRCDRTEGPEWKPLLERLERGATAAAFCLSHEEREFEDWFSERVGRVIHYRSGPHSRETP